MTIVCGDSHTSTHGAMGALAFGIGTSEVEHVLATQTLLQAPAKNMRIEVDGTLGFGCTAKDIVLAIIGKIGTAGGTGHVHRIRRRCDPRAGHGRADDRLQHVDRGGRARRPDRAGRNHVRLGQAAATSRRRARRWDQAVAYWRTLPSDPGAHYDKSVMLTPPRSRRW